MRALPKAVDEDIIESLRTRQEDEESKPMVVTRHAGWTLQIEKEAWHSLALQAVVGEGVCAGDRELNSLDGDNPGTLGVQHVRDIVLVVHVVAPRLALAAKEESARAEQLILHPQCTRDLQDKSKGDTAKD